MNRFDVYRMKLDSVVRALGLFGILLPPAARDGIRALADVVRSLVDDLEALESRQPPKD
jgi:hypothetical protein